MQFLALAAILDFRSIQFYLVFIQKSSCCYRASFDSKRPKIWEGMSKNGFQDGCCGGQLGFSIGSFSYFVSTECPIAHHHRLKRRCPKYEF